MNSRLSLVGLGLAAVTAMVAGRMLRQPKSVALPTPELRRETTVEVTAAKPTQLRRGELLYLTHCAKCQGAEGHGDGDAAVKLQPPPRDFARRPWRFQPTADSIRRVTEEGIPGTAMPATKGALSAAELDAVTKYVLTLAGNSLSNDSESPVQRIARDGGLHLLPQPAMAPNFTVVDAAGKSISLADYRGKSVLIYFWGTGCPHCLQALPAVVRWAEKYRSQGLELLPICADSNDADEVDKLAKQAVPGIRTFVDKTGNLNLRYEVQALPKLCLVDRDGNQVAVGIGTQALESATADGSSVNAQPTAVNDENDSKN
jgi:mono/diheme cytochrome c family protein/peroxiredoxin